MRNEGKPVADVFNVQVWIVMIPAVHPDNETPNRNNRIGVLLFPVSEVIQPIHFTLL